jgi:hypothetical protein
MDFFHVITDATTGETTSVPFTPEEAAAYMARAAAEQAAAVDPVDKLKAFLAANPDVAAILSN